MTTEANERHGTEHEISFIRGIGSHAHIKTRRTELLRKYLESCEHRVDWRGIDKNRVIEFSKKLLEQEEEK